MADTDINILIRMRADINQALGQIKGGLSSLDDTTKKTNTNIIKGFREQLQPFNLLRKTWFQIGALWTATAGTIIKSMSDVNKEINSLDKLSTQLGVSTDDLSRRMYGFNIATDVTRIGVGSLERTMASLKKTWLSLGSAIASGIGEEEIARRMDEIRTKEREERRKAYIPKNRYESELIRWYGQPSLPSAPHPADLAKKDMELRSRAIKELTEEARTRRANTIEAIQLEADFKSQVLKLKGDEYNATKMSLDAQKRYYIETYGEKSAVYKSFIEFYDLQLKKINEAKWGFKDWTDFMRGQIQGTLGSMKLTLAGFFNDTFTGQLQKGKDYFAQFGNAILKMFSNMIAEMVARWALFGKDIGIGGTGFGRWAGILGSIAGLFGRATGAGTTIGARIGGIGPGITGSFGGIPTWSPYHSGGVVRAHSGLAIDEVPIIAQTGERILSRSQNADYEKRSRGITINVNPIITLWDASDVERNKAILISAVSQAITQNAQIRKIIKEYT